MSLSTRQLELLQAARKRLQDERDYAHQLEDNTRRKMQRDERRKKGLAFLGIDEADEAKQRARDLAGLRQTAATREQTVIAHSHIVAQDQRALLSPVVQHGAAPEVWHIGQHFLEATATQVDVRFHEGEGDNYKATTRPHTATTEPGDNKFETILTTDDATDGILYAAAHYYFYVTVAEDARLQNIGALVVPNLGYTLAVGGAFFGQDAEAEFVAAMDLTPPSTSGPSEFILKEKISSGLFDFAGSIKVGGKHGAHFLSMFSNGPGLPVFANEPVLVTVTVGGFVRADEWASAQINLQSGDFKVIVAWIYGDIVPPL